MVKIKLRTFPNSWPALVLSFNNGMNGWRTAVGMGKRSVRLGETLPRPNRSHGSDSLRGDEPTLKRSLALFTPHR